MEEKETFAAFRRIAEQLRTGTRASRTTIRVDCDALGLEMETVAVESRDESAPALEVSERRRCETGPPCAGSQRTAGPSSWKIA